MPKLVIQTVGHGGRSHELSASWITIGRADDNDFQIIDPSISGRHCEIKMAGVEAKVRDLNSTNGTFLNGARITEALLRVGQIVRLGEIEIKLEATVPTFAVPSAIGSKLKPGGQSAVQPVRQAGPAITPTLSSVHKLSAEPVKKPSRKHRVLFVDDSMAFLETITEVCGRMSDGQWEVHTATAADRALLILQQHPVELVVVDIGIPIVDGVQLLGLIHRRYPEMKKAVLTGGATEANRAACSARGAELFVEKPVTRDGLSAVFNMLNDLVSWTPQQQGFSGSLRQVTLQDVVQMVCLARNSSVLEVHGQSTSGQIYIENGAITHAVTETLAGEKALYALLSLAGGHFQSLPLREPPVERTVHENWETILMDCARLRDETAVIGRAPNPSPVAAAASTTTASPVPAPIPNGEPHAPEPKPATVALDASMLPPEEEFIVVGTYDGEWRGTTSGPATNGFSSDGK